MAAGSALGALAPDVGTLIVARALQGASLGVIPLGISIMRDVLPAGRVGSGVALMSSSLGIGGAIGLPLTGLVAEQASWRWLFGGAAVLGALLVVAVLRWVDESPVRAGGRFDLPGAVGLAVALVCLLLAISKGTRVGRPRRVRAARGLGGRVRPSGAASSCAPARRWSTCGSPRGPPCSGRTWPPC